MLNLLLFIISITVYIVHAHYNARSNTQINLLVRLLASSIIICIISCIFVDNTLNSIKIAKNYDKSSPSIRFSVSFFLSVYVQFIQILFEKRSVHNMVRECHIIIIMLLLLLLSLLPLRSFLSGK